MHSRRTRWCSKTGLEGPRGFKAPINGAATTEDPASRTECMTITVL
jgi:hypothetical protein